MFNQLLSPYPTKNKELIKIIRSNKNIKPIRLIKSNSNRKSLQFQRLDKTSLVIPISLKNEHIQIHVDEYYQLVKLMWSKRKWRQ